MNNIANSIKSEIRLQTDRIIVTDSEQSVSIEVIDKASGMLPVSIPVQYKMYLELHNGGRPEIASFGFTEDNDKTASCVDWFYAIHDGVYNNLTEQYLAMRGRVPDRMFPIARDPGSNIICISTSRRDVGSVYFWVRDKEDDGETALCFIAPSFLDFLKKLRP